MELIKQMRLGNNYFILFIISAAVLFFSSCSDDSIEVDPDPDLHIGSLIDGPYIMYEQNIPVKYYRNDRSKIQSSIADPDKEIVVVARGQVPDEFNISLMQEFPQNPDVYDAAEKILVTSDIEGNFYALTRLLKGNGVVDNELNWIFGSNHLVLVGDMVDRGYYVTEVLWLIYKIDKQAEESGGKVHFILGNHDLMCMSGDDRYANPKYPRIAQLIGVDYKELYGPDSEIGRWMRTKNSIEKIGDYLFVHAGISPQVINMGLTIGEMNTLIKPSYGETISSSAPPNVYTLYKSSGLFWYRGFFKANDGVYEKATQYQVNAVLDYFDVQSIIVGHTIVDNICSNYNNAVFAIDVHHPEDDFSNIKFQALLIDDDNIYKVDENGNSILLL